MKAESLSIDFEARVLLTPKEVIILNWLAGYGSNLSKVINEHVSKQHSPEDVDEVLASLRTATNTIMAAVKREKGMKRWIHLLSS